MNKATQRPIQKFSLQQKWETKDVLKRREQLEYREWMESQEGQEKMSQVIAILSNDYL